MTELKWGTLPKNHTRIAKHFLWCYDCLFDPLNNPHEKILEPKKYRRVFCMLEKKIYHKIGTTEYYRRVGDKLYFQFSAIGEKNNDT